MWTDPGQRWETCVTQQEQRSILLAVELYLRTKTNENNDITRSGMHAVGESDLETVQVDEQALRT